MDRGNCDPIDRLGVDIRDGALQYAGDSAVSIRGQVVGDGRVRVRLTNGNQSASGRGQLSASTGMAPVRRVRAPAAGRLNAAELAVAPVTMVGSFFGWRRRLARSPPKPRSGDKPAGQNPRKANGLQRCRNSDALFRGAGDMTGCSTSTSRDTSIASTAGGLKRIK
jgi:hypothetical protein